MEEGAIGSLASVYSNIMLVYTGEIIKIECVNMR